ncbi:MAG: LacI family DNA-binding transcriptional regulator, partial [Victivallales bacterium]|nr:LacI family DNA-binding transcriptional regulator [Victivallales bacterium]
MQTVTIASLAQELGVSTATVAKALNGQGRISAAMVARVRELARERKYVPNISARSLRTNIKDAVGLLITSDIANPWYSLLTSELADLFAKRGLTMLLALGKSSDERLRLAQESFFGGRVCGIVCGPITTREHLEQLRPTLDRQLPLVVFSNLESLPVNFVSLQQETGARLMLEHLYGLGHRRICYLGSPARNNWRSPNTRAWGYTDF